MLILNKTEAAVLEMILCQTTPQEKNYQWLNNTVNKQTIADALEITISTVNRVIVSLKIKKLMYEAQYTDKILIMATMVSELLPKTITK